MKHLRGAGRLMAITHPLVTIPSRLFNLTDRLALSSEVSLRESVSSVLARNMVSQRYWQAG